MDIKPVNPSIYPSPNPSGIKVAFNIDAIKEVSCTRCLHQEVCKYKQDFLDICNKIKTTPITNLDCLGGIQIECRYYQMQAINPRLFDPGIIYHGDPITNPYITRTNPSTFSNDTTAIKKED